MDGHDRHPYTSYVRGVEIDFSPENIRKVMRFKEDTPGAEDNYDNRQNNNPQLDAVLRDLCIQGATWKMGKGKNPKPIQLRRPELVPLARGWQEFIIHNLVPTGNKSEITVARAILIRSIMRGDDIRAEEIIADNIILIAQGLGGKEKLGFPSTIYKLCKAAKVRMNREYGGLEQCNEGRFITAEVMETVRVPKVVIGQHIEHDYDEDEPMPQYVPQFVPENEAGNADFGDQEQEQYQHFEHYYEQPPHFEQPPPQYQQFQQSQSEQMQQYQQSQIGIKTAQGKYIEEVQELRQKQQEFYTNQNNLCNCILRDQDLMAKEIVDMKKWQMQETVGKFKTTHMNKVMEAWAEQRGYMENMSKQMKKWTRNASARECSDIWAHQQLNPNLVEMPVTEVTKLIYENCDKKRPAFYGCLKSDLEAGSSSQAAPPTTPSAAPTSAPAPEPDQDDYYPEQFFQD
ncbi:hypothetical protein PIB30_028153 [Stylosanthes scabra]|uniref:Putative plant transposon protein domain-containing protein n=1 Tax=Stylosanthes scabra TaxID=79078 RepID=A0ABU6X8H2_9FABA|nr:hypothetical protein [Stylosanthes scabra]